MKTMRVITKEETTHIVRFDQEEDVLIQLSVYCSSESIPSATFTALGACQNITIAYYDLPKKKYLDKTYKGDLEIISIIGNISQKDEKYIIHAHGSFADSDYNVFGGHVKELIVSATCEVHLTVLHKKLVRRYDEKTGLNLLQKT